MIGIFGGTFDPIHKGHVQVIENLLRVIDFHRLIVIPNGHPPHKEERIDPQDKLELVKVALGHIPNIHIDDREISSEAPSYAYSTFRKIKIENGGLNLAWVIGSDSFLGIETWYEYAKLLEEVNFVVLERPGFSLENDISIRHILEHRQVNDISELNGTVGKIFILKIDPVELTSTEIRDSIKKNEDVSSLLNQDVYQLIKNKNLYKDK